MNIYVRAFLAMYGLCAADIVSGRCGICSDCVAKTYACKLLSMHQARTVVLKPDHFDSRGNNPYDGAAALSNVQDTCNGRQAKRSSYCSTAPGGCVCLQGNMLRALWTYADQFYARNRRPIQVNSLAGSCHSNGSWHYRGNTFDVACTSPINHCRALVSFVQRYPLNQACFPGSSCGGHETWVHASFK